MQCFFHKANKKTTSTTDRTNLLAPFIIVITGRILFVPDFFPHHTRERESCTACSRRREDYFQSGTGLMCCDLERSKNDGVSAQVREFGSRSCPGMAEFFLLLCRFFSTVGFVIARLGWYVNCWIKNDNSTNVDFLFDSLGLFFSWLKVGLNLSNYPKLSTLSSDPTSRAQRELLHGWFSGNMCWVDPSESYILASGRNLLCSAYTKS